MRSPRTLPPISANLLSGETWLSAEQYRVFQAQGTTAHRLGTSSDGWVERFADDLLISYKHDAARDELLAGAIDWGRTHGLVSRRFFGKRLPRQNEERVAPILLQGSADCPMETVVQENGMHFAIDFGAGYSAGLFLDQRENRTLVRRLGVKRLLNTFAYTCSFSVAAGSSGTETVSVDLSKKSLDRGRENFGLNSLNAVSHRFIADDVIDVLPRLARRGELFDAIILDPPTFSRGNKGQRFQVEHDLEHLLIAALELAAPQAHILLSTNCTRIDQRALESLARFSLKACRKTAGFHREQTPPDIPPNSAAQTLWLRLR